MVECDLRVECAGVSIEPGDIVLGHVDGLVVVLRAHTRPSGTAKQLVDRPQRRHTGLPADWPLDMPCGLLR